MKVKIKIALLINTNTNKLNFIYNNNINKF